MTDHPETTPAAASTPSFSTRAQRTPGPWEYVPSTEHHGPYVCGPFGGDICDCYTMSNPHALSVRNGGDSYPIHHMAEMADANAAFIVRACNAHDELVKALKAMVINMANDGGEYRDCYKAAAAALSKAEGR